MRPTTDAFLINGKPLLAPDAGVSVSYQDLDSAQAGRDQAGFMHRMVVRYKVPSWQFRYGLLTEEERQYLESLFPDAPTFEFTHPSREDAALAQTTRCYRSKMSISWRNGRTGLWQDYGFSVIAV